MENKFEQLKSEIMNDSENGKYTQAGIEPLFMAYSTAKILIIGQSPGIKAQNNKKLFQDKSGEKLRSWLGIDEEIFYKSGLIAVLPMDFYYPGQGESGDLSPRKDFAPKWHKKILALMPNIELTILIGKYAQDYYLGEDMKKNLTQTVMDYQEYLPKYFPIVHPSPLNFRWHIKNTWFMEQVEPDLKKRVEKILF